MNKNELIEKYFNNTLTETEKAALKTLLETNHDFKKGFEFQINIQLAFRNQTREELKTEFKKIDQQNKKSWKSIFLIAASFAIIVALGSYFYSNLTTRNEQLFAQNFKPYPNVIHPVVRGDKNVTSIEKAFVYYENQDYSHFIKALENSNFKNKDYNFYIANAYLASGNTEKSILLLEEYVSNSKSTHSIDACWYLALAYLQNRDTETAKMYLQKVVESSSFLSEKAKKLLTLID